MPHKAVAFDIIPICIQGIKSYFKNYDNFTLAETFTDFDDLLYYLKQNSVDILILSDNIPQKSFPDAVRYLHELYPEMKIIALSEKKSEYEIFSVVKAGASAYLYKPNTSEEELLNALNSAMANEEYFNEPISNIIIQSYVKNAKKGDEISHRNPKNLTRREVQILQLICEGLTNKQIADGLFISVRTVDAHKNHIMQKLGLKSTAELVKFAIKHGYVKL